jgi:hypothetical protein
MRSLAILSAAALLTLPLAAQTPRASVRLDTTDSIMFEGVDSEGTISAAVFNSHPVYSTGKWYVSLSDQSGRSWGSAVAVNTTSGSVANPYTDSNLRPIHVNGSHIYTAWMDEVNGLQDVYFTRSIDGGTSWGTPIRISDSYAAGASDVRDFAWIVREDTVDPTEDVIYIVLATDPTLAYMPDELYLAVSEDAGASFSSPIPVSTPGGANGTADPDSIDLAVQDDTLHILWQDDRDGVSGDNDIWYARSDDRGQTLTFTDVQLNGSTGLSDSSYDEVQIVCQGSYVAACWMEAIDTGMPSTFDQIRFRYSTDDGTSWSTETTVGNYTVNVADVDSARMGIAGNGNVIISWNDNRAGQEDVYVATSADGGVTWTESGAFNTGGAYYPRLEVSNGAAAGICWTGNGGVASPYYDQTRATFSLDSGLTWSADFRVDDNVGDTGYADLSYNDFASNFVLTWAHDPDPTTSPPYNHMTVGGFGALHSWYCGAGTNMDTYTIGADFILGDVFQGTVGFSAPNFGAILAGYLGKLTFPVWGQQGLVNITSKEVTGLPTSFGASPVTITWALPADYAYAGYHVFTQAAGIGGGQINLTCAYECVVGF